MTEIEIPEYIKIGGFDYRIEQGPQCNAELRSSNWAGSHSNSMQLIRISSDGGPQQISDSFIHEILHGVDVVYNNNSSQELVVNSFAHGLLQVMEQLGIRFVLKK